MVLVKLDPYFEKVLFKVKDTLTRKKVFAQIEKLRNNPEIGKPMRHERKGTRELYLSPFRISYLYIKEEDKVVFLDLYHKDEQ